MDLVRRQWNGYARNHSTRANLIIHIVAVPLFLIGNVSIVVAVLNQSPAWAAASLVLIIVSLALQGRGHRLEKFPPEPFTSPANAIARIFVEQWFTFPRFVFSGAWLRALRQES
jgi:hypothetical protein